MGDSKRLNYFDMAKGIGVFLVLLGHMQGEEFFSFSPYILPMCSFIFSFHMPLFFIISGMLIRYKNDKDKDLPVLAGKRFKGIMIPYIWFSIIYLLIVVYALITGGIKVQTLIVQIWYALGMYGINVLWFLPALFAGELLFLWIIKRHSGKLSAAVIIILSIVVFVINYFLQSIDYNTAFLERVHELSITLLRPVIACSFIALGYFIFGFFKHREKSSIPELLLGVALMAVDILLFEKNGSVDFRSMVFGNPLLYYVCALSASVGLILILKNIPNIKPISYFGANSLIVMAVHGNKLIIYLGLSLAMFVNQYITRARGYISYGIVVLIDLIFCVLMILLINKFFGFIVGKSSPFDGFIDKLFVRKDRQDK